MIGQFPEDVVWGDLSYLLIDTPPGKSFFALSCKTNCQGTSDEHITVLEKFRGHHPDGAVLVTTPQAVGLADVRMELNFCPKIGLPVLGLVENMSGFICLHCSVHVVKVEETDVQECTIYSLPEEGKLWRKNLGCRFGAYLMQFLC